MLSSDKKQNVRSPEFENLIQTIRNSKDTLDLSMSLEIVDAYSIP